MLAYDYPLLGIFWSFLMVFIWIAWIFLLIRIFGDIFRNHNTSGVSKAIWSIFVVIFPFLGTLVYLIVHGGGMAQRDLDAAQRQQSAVDSYIRQAAGGSVSTADELTKLAGLRDQGAITDAEFAAQKAKLLA
jgi:hypothetical protein